MASLQNPYKLEKFLIEAYKKESRKDSEFAGAFEAMFNPDSFSQKYQQVNSSLQGLITSGRANKYVFSSPTILDVTLILDDTGVSNYGLASLVAGAAERGEELDINLGGAISRTNDGINDRIKKLLALVHDYDGDLHQSHFLKVTWGNSLDGFKCFLQGIDIRYPLFARNGDPLRAEISLSLIQDLAAEERIRKLDKRSPDLTRFPTIKTSDTLPHIANRAYDDPNLYIQLAQVNGQTNFRRLSPGSIIQTPPIEN